MKLVKLDIGDRSRFHFGRGVRGVNTNFSSDRLFSGLINNYAKLYPETVKSVIEAFKERKIQISSLFYGLEFVSRKADVEESLFYFLPKPKLNYYSASGKVHKPEKIRDADYISINLLNRLSECWSQEEKSLDVDDIKISTLGNKFALTPEEIKGLSLYEGEEKNLSVIHTSSRPRVKVDRWMAGEEGNFFYQEYLEIVHLKLQSYLVKPFHYFVCDGDITKELKAAIRLTAEEGLGGKRSTGAGIYEDIDIQRADFNWPEGKHNLALSCVYPEKEGIKNLYSYNLEEREGYIYSGRGRSLKKPEVRIVTEGSLFAGEVNGEIVDITPEGFKKEDNHPIYLNGCALSVGFGGEDDGT